MNIENAQSNNPQVENERPQNVEANEAWQNLQESIDNFDRFIGTQVKKHSFIAEFTNVLDKEDLKQYALIAAYEGYQDKKNETEAYKRYIKRVCDYHQLEENDAKTSSSVFAGWLKRKIIGKYIDVEKEYLGWGADRDQKGRTYKGIRNTFTESELIKNNQEDQENILDLITVDILESNSELIDATTLNNFERLFDINTNDMDTTKAKDLRKILYEEAYKSIENYQKESAKGSGGYRKLQEHAINTRAAVFSMITENIPVQRMAELSGIDRDSLRKERDRMFIYMLELEPIIVKQVQERVREENI
jgi:hypothetical protein